jgi:hypothetical protein
MIGRLQVGNVANPPLSALITPPSPSYLKRGREDGALGGDEEGLGRLGRKKDSDN